MEGITLTEEDALKEIGNIGVGHAATALSKLLNKKINIDIPEAEVIPLGRLSDHFGGPEKIVQAIYLDVNGEINGKSLLVFPEQGAFHLLDMMMGMPENTTNKMDEETQSAFTEFANIIVGAFLSAMADFVNMKIMPGLPMASNDMVQAIIDSILIDLGRNADELFLIKTNLDVEERIFNGVLLMLFDETSLRMIVDKIKEKYAIDV